MTSYIILMGRKIKKKTLLIAVILMNAVIITSLISLITLSQPKISFEEFKALCEATGGDVFEMLGGHFPDVYISEDNSICFCDYPMGAMYGRIKDIGWEGCPN